MLVNAVGTDIFVEVPSPQVDGAPSAVITYSLPHY